MLIRLWKIEQVNIVFDNHIYQLLKIILILPSILQQ